MRDENGYWLMDTEWHRITCFNGLARRSPSIAKGDLSTAASTTPSGSTAWGTTATAAIIAEKVDFPRPKSAENENPSWSTHDEIPF
ncbi:hypothetical protein [Roseovarius sp.]|uniref:hypothetical protein n=1 Tax=Roseovarius sp. TaxID=1486281 RepID=UPI003A96CDB0